MFKSIWGLGKDNYRRTKLALGNIAEWVVGQWEKRLLENVNPRWWGRQALSNGSINQVRTPYGIKIFYTSKGEYDYMDVVENGRAPFPMKDAFERSPRRKRKVGGSGWYITIPFTTNKEPDEDGKKKSSIVNPSNNNINAIIKKVGEYKDSSGQLRGEYTYDKEAKGMTGQGNVFKAPQKTKGGKVTYSYMKFVTCSDTSGGWMYPAIPAHKIAQGLEKEAEKMMTSNAFKQAIERDTEDFIKSGLRKMGHKQK